MLPPSAILFDLDGVLVRSEEVWLRLLEEAGLRFRGRPITREEFAPTFGQGTAADVRAFGLSCTAAELDTFYVQNFRRYATELWVDPGARPLLDGLSRRGLRLAVVTNTVSPLARDLLAIAGLLEFFQVVATADLAGRPKPSPDIVLHALAGLGLPPQEAWMVGDSRFDREAARGAGVHFVGLRTEGDVTVGALEEIPALLGPVGSA